MRLATNSAGSGTARSAWVRARGVLLGGLVLLVSLAGSWAWDADQMLAAAQALGPRAVSGARDLQSLLGRLAAMDETARLEAVNAFFNRRVTYAEDMAIWQQQDYWASPLETLSKGEGDCEDYSIAKYFALVSAGVPVAKLRMVYVRAQVPGGRGQPSRVLPHMVLAYYPAPAEDPLVLDNLIPDIRRASTRTDLSPIYSFNSEGLWQGTAGPTNGNPIERISSWRNVVRKAQLEGFF